MLRTLFLLSMFFPVTLSAQSLSLEKSSSEAERIRTALNTFCLDNWCEGPYNLQFQNVVLAPKLNKVDLFFRAIRRDDNLKLPVMDGSSSEARILSQNYELMCSIKGFSEEARILASPSTLRADFYRELTQCIEQLQDRLLSVLP